jgi:ATP-binding cassette, subfamily C (CFTR/MRP), member 10
MPELPCCLNVHAATDRLEAEFSLRSNLLNADGCSPFYRCLFAAHGRGHYLFLGFVKFFTDCLGVASPFLLRRFLDWLQSSDGDVFWGALYVALMAGIALLGAIITPHYNYQISCIALNVRSSIMASVFRRCAMHQPQQPGSLTSHDTSATNLINIDSQRVADTVSSFNELWSLPVQVALSFYLLYCQVGWSFLAGVLFMLLVIPINTCLARIIQRSTSILSTHRDCRIERMRRMLKGVRTIKSFSLERHCVAAVSHARSLEFAQLRRRKLADSGCVLFWAVTPVVVVLATIAACYWMNPGSELSTGQLFSTITLLNMLVYPFNAFPWVINGIMEARVSAARLQKFVANVPSSFPPKRAPGDADSLQRAATLPARDCRLQPDSTQAPPSLSLSNVVIAACPTLHTVTQSMFKLGPISLELKAPHILAVVGPVSSGKSVFLRALACECAVASGSFETHSNISYSSQEPFLFDGTVLDNILFGATLDRSVLNQVTASCGLDRDAKSWAGGLSYGVGPGGRRCSSGQRMRISVARTLYRSTLSAAACISIMDGPTTGLDDALVHTVLQSLIALAQRGSIVCVSFASQLHLKILLDECPSLVTVLSFQQRSAPQILPGSAFSNLEASFALPGESDKKEPLELRDSSAENQEAVPEEHREFGGLCCDLWCLTCSV